MRLSPAFGHILKSKSETQTTLDQHQNFVNILAKGTKNFQRKHVLMKDKFNVMIGSHGPPTLDKANSV